MNEQREEGETREGDQIVIQSPERLVHFRCPTCQGWWSIGDAPEREYWFCPWCGRRSLTKGGTVPVEMSDGGAAGGGVTYEQKPAQEWIIGDDSSSSDSSYGLTSNPTRSRTITKWMTDSEYKQWLGR